MKLGENIREIRVTEKNFKRSYIARELKISTRAYCNIENNITELTISRLEQISRILNCSLSYIINYKQAKGDFYNYFHNHNGNSGINIMNQGFPDPQINEVLKLQEELLASERSRLPCWRPCCGKIISFFSVYLIGILLLIKIGGYESR